MADLDAIGGLPVVMKELLEAGLIHGDCLTVTGRTLAENLQDTPSLCDLPQQVPHPPASTNSCHYTVILH